MSLCSCAGGGRPALGTVARVECAPFARAVTGVRLYGPADSWWQEAAGRYRRNSAPSVGSLLVLRRSARLPSGHVSVVSAVVSARHVLLTQANWLHGHIGIDRPALDVSAQNDWSAVRVYWPPSGVVGSTIYPAYGFIVPDAPPGHGQITAAAGGVVR
jgi:surface antigen